MLDAIQHDRTKQQRRYAEAFAIAPKGWWGRLSCKMTGGHDFTGQSTRWLHHMGRAWYYGKCLKCGWHLTWDGETSRSYLALEAPPESEMQPLMSRPPSPLGPIPPEWAG